MSDTLEPPVHDMLTVRFRGDDYQTTLPYCEVANGSIVSARKGLIVIDIHDKEKDDKVELTPDEFCKLIENSFNTKELSKLELQMAGNTEKIKLL